MTADGNSFASFYDFYDPPEYRKAQLAMYVGLARETGDPILELACGTGIITLELAHQGFHVTGIDISPDMLAVAREKLAREEPATQARIEYVEGDMVNFDLGKQFRAILIPTNSFGYLTTMDAQKRCLAAAYRHLDSGGTIVIEERFYTPDVLARLQANRGVPTVQMARVNPATGKYTTFHWITTHIDLTRQIVHSCRFVEEVEPDGTVRRVVPEGGGKTSAHFFNTFELQLLVEQAGFEIAHLWGGHDRQPITSTSRSMIVLARRK